MNTKSKLSIAALAAVLGLGLTVGATSPSVAQLMGPDGGHGGRSHHAGFHGPRADRIDGRVAFLKAELKITAAQESKWQDFEKVLRSQAAERKLAGEKMRAEWQAKGQPAPQPTGASVTAVERMERQQKFMKARLENQEKVLDAFKPLYAALTDDQKKTADQLFGGGHGGRGHGMRRG